MLNSLSFKDETASLTRSQLDKQVIAAVTILTTASKGETHSDSSGLNKNNRLAVGKNTPQVLSLTPEGSRFGPLLNA